MIIGDWEASKHLNEAYRYIRKMGLEANIAELEAFGFTIIEDAVTQEEVERCKATVLAVAERRLGCKLDIDQTENLKGMISGSPLLTNLLFEDVIFEDFLLKPGPQSVIGYLMGQSVKLHGLTSIIKSGGADGMTLHTDIDNGVPDPLPVYSCFGNLTYALTDYTLEGGALAMVPGSHRYCRHPNAQESVMTRGRENPLAIPVTAKAGSAIIWHGNTWHGAFARNTPGLRMSLTYSFCRQFLETQQPLKGRVPAEAWERHAGDDRFASLMGEYSLHGWQDDKNFVDTYSNPRRRQAGDDWYA